MPDQSEVEKVLPLSPTAFHVLVAMAQGPKHGYAIAQEVKELTGGRIVMGPGTLYGSLQRLVASELIAETDNPGDEGLHAGRRRYYRITPLGAMALRSESERLRHAVNVAQERLGT